MTSYWIHFRADPELFERIARAAAADRRSVSEWVRLACEITLISAEQDWKPDDDRA